MTLEAENNQLKAEIQELKRELLYVGHELDQLKQMIFSSRSERSKTLFYDNGQMKLFEEEQPAEKHEVKKIKIRSHDKVKIRKKPKRTIFRQIFPEKIRLSTPKE